jgi:aspergillopepsin I
MRGSTWSITYADGTTASGDVYRDTVNVGGAIVSSQAVEVALQVSEQIQERKADGMLGLASSDLNTSMSSLMFCRESTFNNENS